MPVKTRKNKAATDNKKPVKNKHSLKIKVKRLPLKKESATPVAPVQKTENQKSVKNDIPKNQDLSAPAITPKIISENVEQDKNLILWSGVVFFMLLIIFFWARHTGEMFQKTESEDSALSTLSDWRVAADDIAARMKELKSDLEEIRIKSEENSGTGTTPVLNLNPEITPSTTTPDISTTSIDIKTEEIEKLKIRLEELETLIKNKN